MWESTVIGLHIQMCVISVLHQVQTSELLEWFLEPVLTSEQKKKFVRRWWSLEWVQFCQDIYRHCIEWMVCPGIISQSEVRIFECPSVFFVTYFFCNGTILGGQKLSCNLPPFLRTSTQKRLGSAIYLESYSRYKDQNIGCYSLLHRWTLGTGRASSKAVGGRTSLRSHIAQPA